MKNNIMKNGNKVTNSGNILKEGPVDEHQVMIKVFNEK